MNRIILGLALCAAGLAPLGASLSRAEVDHRTSGAQSLSGLPVDPGVRGGTAGAGGFLTGLSADELAFANAAAVQFAFPWSVSGKISGEPLAGLGPRYNANGCSVCHSYPSMGGSTPLTNPQVAMAALNGATNKVPSGTYAKDGLAFIRSDGPVRVPYQTSTGNFLRLYTIIGRSDAPPGCTSAVMQQPNFSSLLAANDISPRIPIPFYGIGLVEDTPSSNLISAQNTSLMTSLGITPGRFNIDGNGTIGRLGWKASTPSTEYFTAFALAGEIGATTNIFPRKSDETTGCQANPLPEDVPLLIRRTPNTSSISADYASQQVLESAFARYLAPPVPVTSYIGINGPVTTASISNGQAKFISVGCVACHVQSHTTGNSTMTGQSKLIYTSWSDYALHNMGAGLADGLRQGSAGPQDYKTTALWGLGQRIFFLHDGRTSDLYQAILSHSSSQSEANSVLSSFQTLSTSDQQDILNFLRAQ